jgi:hypothetical protein
MARARARDTHCEKAERTVAMRGRVVLPPPQLPPLRRREVLPLPTTPTGCLREMPTPLPSQLLLQPQPSPPPPQPSPRQQPPPSPDPSAGEAAVGRRLMVFSPDEGRGGAGDPRNITDRA